MSDYCRTHGVARTGVNTPERRYTDTIGPYTVDTYRVPDHHDPWTLIVLHHGEKAITAQLIETSRTRFGARHKHRWAVKTLFKRIQAYPEAQS